MIEFIHKKTVDCLRDFYKAIYSYSFWKRDVRVIGLEPTRLTAPDPKSGAAANYATPASEF